MRYTVILEKEEDGGYVATFPFFPAVFPKRHARCTEEYRGSYRSLSRGRARRGRERSYKNVEAGFQPSLS
jgi:hypothetical protein